MGFITPLRRLYFLGGNVPLGEWAPEIPMILLMAARNPARKTTWDGVKTRRKWDELPTSVGERRISENSSNCNRCGFLLNPSSLFEQFCAGLSPRRTAAQKRACAANASTFLSEFSAWNHVTKGQIEIKLSSEQSKKSLLFRTKDKGFLETCIYIYIRHWLVRNIFEAVLGFAGNDAWKK